MEHNIDVIDFHSHILPAADHGSSSVEESLLQLDLAKLNNVRRIVATPHFYPDRHNVELFIRRRDLAWDALKSNKSPEHPKIALGAEVLICDGLERLDGLEKLCIKDTNILLLELPFSVFKSEYRDSVYRLIKKGYRIVLAHADRYDEENIDLLLECGAQIQLNAEALSGFNFKSYIKRWILQGSVVAVGSDIHTADKHAYVRFEKAKKRLSKLGALESVKASSDNMNINFD